MQFELTGRIIAILPTQSGAGRNGEWVKNSFVIEWQDNGYTQKLCLEVVGADKFDKMKNAVRVGNEVLCRFNVTSREWQNRWFTTANVFYCATVGGQQQQTPQQRFDDQSKSAPSGQQAPPPVEDQLPF